MKELKSLQELVKEMEGLLAVREDILVLIEMAYEENEDSMVKEIQSEIQGFETQFEELRTRTLLSGEYDGCNAIVTIHAGAGGTESCDWAGMLYRMYTRWAERKGFSIQVLDFLDGDITGIKGVTFQVNGENAYGYLKSVNKTSSAIRITHLPTGIVVQCQNERSQHHNKEKAMQMLKVKLKLLKEQEQAEKVSDIRGEVKEIGFGNQIRSYVMQPYTLVKDHRTNVETGNVSAVLDGDIDLFINAYLKETVNT